MYATLEIAVGPGEKAQVFDLDRLEPPLRGIPDDPNSDGFEEGHFAVAPVDARGDVDLAQLIEWAETRETGTPHKLTLLLRKALAIENEKRPR